MSDPDASQSYVTAFPSASMNCPPTLYSGPYPFSLTYSPKYVSMLNVSESGSSNMNSKLMTLSDSMPLRSKPNV